jgi:hypothetical protein
VKGQHPGGSVAGARPAGERASLACLVVAVPLRDQQRLCAGEASAAATRSSRPGHGRCHCVGVVGVVVV